MKIFYSETNTGHPTQETDEKIFRNEKVRDFQTEEMKGPGPRSNSDLSPVKLSSW